MGFTPVPKESKNQIKKAGQILVRGQMSLTTFKQFQEYDKAVELTNRWRACHAYPINTFQSTLRRKLKSYPDTPIAAQRLKRMPTIVDKLQRYSDMQLTTMQDIGGVRAILNSVNDAQRLVDDYLSYINDQRFSHELVNAYDYIETPRDEDGYRSIHLVYKYMNKANPAYNGLRLEMQIRSKLQHIWATAVETMGTFLGQALKSRKGDKEWLDFFAIVSSAIAHKEKCNPVPRFMHLNKRQTYDAVAEAEAKLGALEQMTGFSAAIQDIVNTQGSRPGRSYYLITLNSIEQTVKIQSYDRHSFDSAVKDYSEAEERASQGQKIEPVLVASDDPIRAYPNFFLDIREFIKLIKQIISDR